MTKWGLNSTPLPTCMSRNSCECEFFPLPLLPPSPFLYTLPSSLLLPLLPPSLPPSFFLDSVPPSLPTSFFLYSLPPSLPLSLLPPSLPPSSSIPFLLHSASRFDNIAHLNLLDSMSTYHSSCLLYNCFSVL